MRDMGKEGVRYHVYSVPVVDGIATLPDGRLIQTDAERVEVAFLTPAEKAALWPEPGRDPLLIAYDDYYDSWTYDL